MTLAGKGLKNPRPSPIPPATIDERTLALISNAEKWKSLMAAGQAELCDGFNKEPNDTSR